MDMFVVRGGKPLNGRVRISGSKNAALPIMAASLMADGPVILHDVPDLVDVRTLSELLGTLGVISQRQADKTLRLEVIDDSPVVADYELVRRMRASICVLGPLLARRGRATVSLPGGCNIGDRPIDLHLKGLKALGADIRIERGYVIAKADRLRGARVFLGGSFGSTVTGTCNVMAAAALADGVTTIESAACEPEVADYGDLLNAMGAKIEGLGTPFLRIEGVQSLSGAEHHVIPDRIEAATLLIAAAITRGEVVVENVRTAHLSAVLDKLNDVGVRVGISDDAREADRSTLHVFPSHQLTPTECSALPYPGLPTDVQAQFMALLSRADGISVVTDKVFPDRFMHVAELVRLGARIHREGQSAIISGTNRLHGACVMASDLRASAALVLAAMAADGESVIRRIYHLDRGYEQLEKRLNSLGADIRRVEDCAENVPASLRLTQPVVRASSLSETETTDATFKLENGRQIRIDEAESVFPVQSSADSKAEREAGR
ncbi:MAG: UDP-N-acetylglucosamine 1-carboxyvinyltransferase [Planctomycetota bacterium]|nr:UDP-N-acetylglucosamine 1-carboxyvinyltransferase [Planctomycetota bacterium]MDA0920607.1 UDP-N-acetylglucosamine 1-carboxyvinyltransferase [Planctomycetota bacterium]MDA1159318.1 UDP-N-acetylglucosamine 1-carboxyvinyltransferase [Planctomycetota bacterium]